MPPYLGGKLVKILYRGRTTLILVAVLLLLVATVVTILVDIDVDIQDVIIAI